MFVFGFFRGGWGDQAVATVVVVATTASTAALAVAAVAFHQMNNNV